MKYLEEQNYNIAIINGNKLDQLISNVAVSGALANSRIELFESASEAMDFFFKKKFYPDLVILDLNIGELSGKAFITLMHHSKNLDCIPIIIVSRLGNEEDMLKWGADDFYYRPSDFRGLIQLFEEIRYKWLQNEEIFTLLKHISVQ